MLPVTGRITIVMDRCELILIQSARFISSFENLDKKSPCGKKGKKVFFCQSAKRLDKTRLTAAPPQILQWEEDCMGQLKVNGKYNG